MSATALLISAGISAIGTIQAGRAAKQASELNAYQIKTDKVLNDLQVMQQIQARREEHELATSSNVASFFASGRDVGSDRSVNAFLKRQKETIGTDVTRSQMQNYFEGQKSAMAAMAERRRGRNALMASYFDAASTMASGYGDYKAAQ